MITHTKAIRKASSAIIIKDKKSGKVFFSYTRGDKYAMVYDKAKNTTIKVAFREFAKLAKAGCFVAGTPILTPLGSKPIETFKPGDQIISRPEGDVNGIVRIQTVEEVFRLSAPTLKIGIDSQVIETTAEHPFFVNGQGWIDSRDLQIGDKLVGADGSLLSVESVIFTGEAKPVYNLHVSEDHTYFVGNPNWEFSVWVHNTYSVRWNARIGQWSVWDSKLKPKPGWVKSKKAKGILRFGRNKKRPPRLLRDAIDKLNGFKISDFTP